jgi:hypothetical protein
MTDPIPTTTPLSPVDSGTGLPDDLFSNQNTNLGKFLGPWNRNVCYSLWPFGIYYGSLVHIIVIWKINSNLVYFPPFWYLVSRKIWQPCFTRFVFPALDRISNQLEGTSTHDDGQ